MYKKQKKSYTIFIFSLYICERAFDESNEPWHPQVNFYRVLIEFISSSDFSVYFRELYCLIMIMRHFQLYENKDMIKIYTRNILAILLL